MIKLVAWRELEDTQFMGAAKKPFLVERYVNLWNIVCYNIDSQFFKIGILKFILVVSEKKFPILNFIR